MKSDAVGGFTPWKLAPWKWAYNTTQSHLPHLGSGEPGVKHLPTPGWMLGKIAISSCVHVSSLWTTSGFSYGCIGQFHCTQSASHCKYPLSLSSLLVQDYSWSHEVCPALTQGGAAWTCGESMLPGVAPTNGGWKQRINASDIHSLQRDNSATFCWPMIPQWVPSRTEPYVTHTYWLFLLLCYTLPSPSLLILGSSPIWTTCTTSLL